MIIVRLIRRLDSLGISSKITWRGGWLEVDWTVAAPAIPRGRDSGSQAGGLEHDHPTSPISYSHT
jgi:hypothetical protein